jgi:hypothetical protein
MLRGASMVQNQMTTTTTNTARGGHESNNKFKMTFLLSFPCHSTHPPLPTHPSTHSLLIHHKDEYCQ